jgi:hypothetical protein
MSDVNASAASHERGADNYLIDENPTHRMGDLSRDRPFLGSPKVRFQLPPTSNPCNVRAPTATNLLSCRTLHAGSIPHSVNVSIPLSAQNFDSSVEMTLRDFQKYLEQCGCWYNNTIFEAGSKAALHLDPCSHFGVEVSLQDFIMNGHLHVVEQSITDWTEEIQVNDSSRSAVLVMMEQNDCLEVQTLHTYDDLAPPNLLNASFDQDDGDSVTVDMNESCSSYQFDEEAHQFDEDDSFYVSSTENSAIWGLVTPPFSDIETDKENQGAMVSAKMTNTSSPLLPFSKDPSEDAEMEMKINSQPYDCFHDFRRDTLSDINALVLLEKDTGDAKYAKNDRSDVSLAVINTSCDIEPALCFDHIHPSVALVDNGSGEATVSENEVPVDNGIGKTACLMNASFATIYFIVHIIILRFSFYIRSRE